MTSVAALEHRIRAGWCRWTSDPVDQPAWTDANRASAEHTAPAFAAPEELNGLPVAYAELIEACSSRPRS